MDKLTPPVPRGRRRARHRLPARSWRFALGALVAGLLIAGAWVVGGELGSSARPRRAPAAIRQSAPMVAFTDPSGLIAGAYPAGWRRLPSGDPQIVLLVAGAGGASLLVRETPLSAAVGPQNLAAGKRLATQIVRSGDDEIPIRPPQEVTLGGLPGYLYLYSFWNQGSGQRGAHAHYFLFDGRVMVTLVFQALPATRIVALAPLFDRIAATFRALPAGRPTVTPG